MLGIEGAGIAFPEPAWGIHVRAQVGVESPRFPPVSLVVFGVFLAVIHSELYCVIAWLASSRTDFPMLICGLEVLDQLQSCVHGTPRSRSLTTIGEVHTYHE